MTWSQSTHCEHPLCEWTKLRSDRATAAGGSGGHLQTVASDQTQFRVNCPPGRILFVTRVTAHVLWGGFIFLRVVSNLIHTPSCQVNIIRPLNR